MVLHVKMLQHRDGTPKRKGAYAHISVHTFGCRQKGSTSYGVPQPIAAPLVLFVPEEHVTSSFDVAEKVAADKLRLTMRTGSTQRRLRAVVLLVALLQSGTSRPYFRLTHGS